MANHPVILNALVAITMIAAAIRGSEKVENRAISIVHHLDLYANIETIGVVADGLNLPETGQLRYRQQGETTWRTGHPLTRIRDGRLVGSLFGLSPVTSYEILVMAGGTEFGGAIATQADQLQYTPAVILHVDDDAPDGGDGSAAAPFRTIQKAVNRAGPGTQVLVADGIYREPVTFPASGNPYQWIQVKAEGRGAILDGSVELTGNVWTPHPSKARVWVRKMASPVGYVAREEERFYSYDDLSGLMKSRGHGKVTIDEGWYFDRATLQLYIRSQDDPSLHKWRVSQFAHAFEVNGRDWIWIEGFEMQFYGRCGVCSLNASHLVVRANKIHNTLLGIFADWSGDEQRGNDTRIEENEISDPLVNEFPWEAVKGSFMEGTGIIVRGHIGAIVRGNHIHNYFNGIYTGSSGALQNPAVAFDADIYNNDLHDIADDALEPEGACVNHRFRNNRIDATLVGISLAPITQGPTWVIRNVLSNYTSMGIKWGSNSYGAVYIYHNTGWTHTNDANAMELITPVSNSVMRNNIFQSTAYAFVAAHNGSSRNDWDNDNWYTTLGPVLPHFNWEKRGYETIAQLCTATGLECKGYDGAPGFTNPGSGNFTLLSSSPNVDRGVLLPGINDRFKGNAPDVGAFELGLPE